LRAIQGFSPALAEDQAERLDAEGREYVERVVRAAARLDLLIQDLLAYSRLSRAEFVLSRVDLDLAVRDALSQLDAELAAHGANVDVVEPLPAVRAHRGTLVQVLVNLVGNAAKFVAPGTSPRVRISAERRGRHVRCFIDDNGIGVAREHRERIFRVFERLHGIEAYPGTGIGLAIVRKGLERMGGSAGCDDHDGGSRFWIELPGIEEVS
jgi:signal transduction histidine kinase